MLVSWQWLKQYVALEMPIEQLEHRLMMSGLNHEGTEPVGEDFAIDLEVTSNRPDCLGHIGVAREVAVLYDLPLAMPAAQPAESTTPVESLARVSLECPDLCSRYTARVLQGVQVGPSPDWLVERLRTVYQPKMKETWKPINNLVDITNYVLMECGQPLHVFDLAKLHGSQIVVRHAKADEPFEAINHKTYALQPEMCVIADADRTVALAGVMGGSDSEVSASTTDILIESAAFDPVSVRTTARQLVLHSDSSYRFERRPDPEAVDWASRRCCELILEIAGGQLASGMLDVGKPSEPRAPIVLRLEQLERILGIAIPADTVRRILTALGNTERRAESHQIEVIPPTWRQDLQREIDLVEEVARIHGYDKIPEDVQVPMAASSRSDDDRITSLVRRALCASGFDEAMTASVVGEELDATFSPWCDAPPLQSGTPLLRGATCLRRSLIPSLLAARRTNERLANEVIELFEVANVYWPDAASALPTEERMIGLVSGRDFFAVKGAIETVLREINPKLRVEVAPAEDALWTPGHSGELQLAGETLGVMGEVCPTAQKKLGLRGTTVVAELKMSVLRKHADLIPQHARLSAFPAIDRDMNFEVDESVRWSDLAETVRRSAGEYCEEVRHIETYRDEQRLGPDRKSLVLKVVLRKSDGTLTGEEADGVRKQVESACQADHGAVLRA